MHDKKVSFVRSWSISILFSVNHSADPHIVFSKSHNHNFECGSKCIYNYDLDLDNIM